MIEDFVPGRPVPSGYVWMHGHDLGLNVAENYQAFAEDARGRSPLYEAVAGDEAILCFLGSLPLESASPTAKSG